MSLCVAGEETVSGKVRKVGSQSKREKRERDGGGMGLISQGLSLRHSTKGGRREQKPERKLSNSPEGGEPGEPCASETTLSFHSGSGPPRRQAKKGIMRGGGESGFFTKF